MINFVGFFFSLIVVYFSVPQLTIFSLLSVHFYTLCRHRKILEMFYLLMGTRRPLCQREPTAETRTDLQSNRNKRIHFLYTALS